MKRDDDTLEKELHRHLGLFGAPATSQLDVSRERVLQRLSARGQILLSTPAEARAPRRTWRVGLSMAAAAVLIVLVSTVRWPGAESLGSVEAADGSLYSLSGSTRRRSARATRSTPMKPSARTAAPARCSRWPTVRASRCARNPSCRSSAPTMACGSASARAASSSPPRSRTGPFVCPDQGHDGHRRRHGVLVNVGSRRLARRGHRRGSGVREGRRRRSCGPASRSPRIARRPRARAGGDRLEPPGGRAHRAILANFDQGHGVVGRSSHAAGG